jgi:transposase
MVWGCITAEDVGELVLIDGIMDSKKYIEILKAGLIKTIEKKGLDPKKVIFQHDNDPKHTAKITKEWLSRNKIEVMSWPAQSPDMNPIENLWDIIDRKIRKRTEKPKNKEELWAAVREEWYALDNEVVRNLYLSMTDRIGDLKNAKGSYTRW